jgi:mannose-6-phosphate isomerase
LLRTITRMQNPIMEYAWGSRSAIPELLGIQNPEQKPMAEMWIGAHPKASSAVFVDGKWISLDEVIRSSPNTILGGGAARRFENRLPFLFKVLAAENPLSIQVHPDLEQAKEGYRRENELGFSLGAPERNYRDPNHKPEIICALDYFDVLKGFRKIDAIIYLLKKVSSGPLDSLIDLLMREPDERGMRVFFRTLMTMKKEKMAGIITGVAEQATEFAENDPAFGWIVALEEAYPGDPGILAPLFLNLVQLRPGEALFLPAGELHSYLRGVGIELMANSDNVIRAGLTKKNVDVPELLKITRFAMGNPPVLGALRVSRGREVYTTPSEEFVLSRIHMEDEETYEASSRDGVEILLCTEGEGEIVDAFIAQRIQYRTGMAFFVPAGVKKYRISGTGTLFSASVPPTTTRK